MFQKRSFFLLSIILLGSTISISSTQQRPVLGDEDVKAWKRMVRITGHIYVTNHPTLGRAPIPAELIAFRRTDRSNHVVAVRADIDGGYEIFLAPGRYKIIVPDLNAERNGFVERFAAGQSRYLDVEKNPSGIKFDVNLALPN